MELFEAVADALRGMVPGGLGPVHTRWHRYGVKAWFGDPERPDREHYEAQVVGARDVPAATVLAIEIGFHAEHPKPDLNDDVLLRLVAAEAAWRGALGPDAEAGSFLGSRDDWCRLSEVWPDPNLDDDELGVEVAARFTDYIEALEPLRRVRPAGS